MTRRDDNRAYGWRDINPTEESLRQARLDWENSATIAESGRLFSSIFAARCRAATSARPPANGASERSVARDNGEQRRGISETG